MQRASRSVAMICDKLRLPFNSSRTPKRTNRSIMRQSCQRARLLQNRLIELFDAMLYTLDFPEGFRVGAELRGFRFGRSRQPLSESQQREREKLTERLGEILAKLGYGF